MFKSIVASLAVSLPLAWSGSALAQQWPTKPVKVVVPGGAGSGTDITARIFTDALSRKFGQPFVVDNRAGANGMIGTEYVAKQPADGYTLLFSYTAAQVVNQSLYPKTGYDGAKDFAPIVQIGSGGNFLIVPASMPVKDLKEFIAYVKAKPEDELAYGSWGNGSGGHLSMEALKQQTGVKIRHVPYKSSAAANTDLAGGVIQVAFSATASALPLIQAGKVKALAISGPNRLSTMPEVKTMTEQGVKFDLASWYGMFAPAGTPPAIVNAINAEVHRLLQLPEMRETLGKVGLSDWPVKTPEEFAATVRNDVKEWGDIVRKGNIKVD